LRVTDKSVKSFVVIGRIGKKPAIYCHVIGKYPATSLAVARQQSHIIWPMMEAGRNPREEAKQQQADTFEKPPKSSSNRTPPFRRRPAVAPSR
jgi:Arm DNA-binding domain